MAAPDRRGSTNAGRPEVFERTLAAGAEKETNITVSGIRRGTDRILSVVFFNLAEEKVKGITDVTAQASITSDGNIQLSETKTTGGVVDVIWAKRRP